MIVVDANVLLRLAVPNDPSFPAAQRLVATLHRQGLPMGLVAQSLMEFWAVATRPAASNGIGLSPGEAGEWLQYFARLFPTLADAGVPADQLLTEWKRLVTQYEVKGKTTHDARYVAAMLCSGVDTLLTFNVPDFLRFPIRVLNPVTGELLQRQGEATAVLARYHDLP